VADNSPNLREEILSSMDFSSYYENEIGSIGKANPKDWVQVLCPFHADKNPSLSINIKNGAFKCFGCDAKGSVFDFHMKKYNLEFKGALMDLAKFAGIETDNKAGSKKMVRNAKFVHSYDYIDESGNLLFQVCRFENPKTFRQRQPDGKGGWIWNLDGIETIPYRLPEIKDSETVYIAEGEKDCDKLASLGLTASCNPMGAGKFKDSMAKYFLDKKIVILPDNDEPGQEHAIKIANTLCGTAKTIKIVNLPDLPEKGDVSDWLNQGNIAEKLLDFVEQTEEWTNSKETTKSDTTINTATPPIDIFGDVNLAGIPDWPEEAVPPVIDNYALDCSQRLGVDVAMIAIPAIVAMASMFSDKIKVQPKQYDFQWVESARLWAAVVAEPGEKKTPAINLALKPVKEIEKKLYMEDKALLEKYESDLEKYSIQIKKKNSQNISKPQKPKQRRRMVDDATIEGLSEILNDNPGGILCIKDELSGWIGSFDAYRSSKSGSKDRAAWLELYNGGPKTIDRIKRGRVFVENWSASLLGGIQPGPMKRLMGKITDDGLLQRIIVFYGKRKGDGEDRPPNFGFLVEYDETIKKLAAIKIRKKSYIIKFSPGAQNQRKLMTTVAQNVMILPDTSPAFKAHLSKWDALYARIALTYHVVENVSARKKKLPQFISADTASRAAKLMIDFLLPNAARFYSELTNGNQHLNHARWIAGHILAKKIYKITARDIYRAYRELRNDPDAINKAMQALTVSGWVKPTKFGKNNLPQKWLINLQVHIIFAERAKIEKKRRQEVRIKIYNATRFLGLDNETDQEHKHE